MSLLCTIPEGIVQAGESHAALYGIRPLGMGNAFVAVADDRNTLYYNPAGLSNLEHMRISGIGLFGGLDNEFFEVVDFIQSNEEVFSDFDNITQEFYESLAPFDDKWVAADASAYVDMTRPGLGIGIFTAARVQVKVDRGVYEPRVFTDVSDDIVGVLGASRRLYGNLSGGFALKGMWRRESTRELSATEVIDFDPQEIVEDLESARGGFGMDLGVSWKREESGLRVGAVLRDAPGFVNGESIGAALDLGTAWTVLAGRGPLKDILLAADLRDVLGEGVLGTKIHLGAEAHLPFVSARVGFNQGYPTLGASFDARFFALDYAFFGRELGRLPGAEDQFMHALEARLGF